MDNINNLYKKFTFIDKQGKKKLYEIHIDDALNFAIHLIEDSFTKNLGPIFIYDDHENEWKELDYYNDL